MPTMRLIPSTPLGCLAMGRIGTRPLLAPRPRLLAGLLTDGADNLVNERNRLPNRGAQRGYLVGYPRCAFLWVFAKLQLRASAL